MASSWAFIYGNNDSEKTQELISTKNVNHFLRAVPSGLLVVEMDLIYELVFYSVSPVTKAFCLHSDRLGLGRGRVAFCLCIQTQQPVHTDGTSNLGPIASATTS